MREKGTIMAEELLLVSTEPAGASVEVDGKTLRELSPTVIAVAAGKHMVRAHLAGHTDVEQVAELGKGERTLVELSLFAQLDGSSRVTFAASPRFRSML